MKQTFIIASIILYFNSLFAQTNSIATKQPKILEKDAVIFFINSRECANCYIFLNDALNKVLASNYKNNIAFITDNKVFTKKLLKELDYDDTSNIFFDKKAFGHENIQGYNTILIKNINPDKEQYFNKSNYESKKFADALSNKLITYNLNNNTIYPFKNNVTFEDSVLSEYMFSSGISNYGAIIFDETLQSLYYIQEIDNKLSIKWATPKLTDSVRYLSFSDEISRNTFDTTTYFLGIGILKENKIPILNVKTIKIHNNTVFSFFTINKVFKRKNADEYGVFSTNYLATKKLHTQDAFQEIHDLDKYDSYYFFDTLSMNQEVYPFRPWIADHAEILSDSTFKINVNYINNANELVFGGRGLVKLDKKNNTKTLSSVDTTAERSIKIDNKTTIQGKHYEISKKMIDEENNYGIIKIEEIKEK